MGYMTAVKRSLWRPWRDDPVGVPEPGGVQAGIEPAVTAEATSPPPLRKLDDPRPHNAELPAMPCELAVRW
jgi:hypothetical protein